MKIEAGNVTLGDDGAGDYIAEGWCPAQQRMIQVEDLYGATSPFRAGRGNVRTTVQFTVVKAHADRAAAVDHCLTHADNVPIQSTVKVTHGLTVREYADALIPSVEIMEIHGATTTTRYQVVCGEFTETELPQ